MIKVLIVEDETLVAMEIESALKREGFYVCNVVDNGEEAIESVKECQPDVVLMDIYLRGKPNGIDTCQKIKSIREVPVIFLTAYSDKKTIERAVDCTPDGYLVKPFRRDELVAMIRVAVKKYEPQERLVKICDDVMYDRYTFEVVRGEERIPLTKKEVELLEFCLSRKGQVIQFNDLEYALWPEGSIADATRRTLIHRLRSKITSKCLKTIPGIGCKIEDI